MLQEESLRFYRPHATQEAFHRSWAKKRALFGGNQSGKTVAGGHEIAMAIGKVHPYRPNYVGQVFARDLCVDFGVLKSVHIPLYRSLLPRHACELAGETFEGKKRYWPGLRGETWDSAWSNDERIIYLADGSFIEFKSYEQYLKNPDSLAGPPRHVIRFDEEPPLGAFNECVARQVTTGQNLIFTMTPLNYSQWIHGQIYEASASSPDVDVFMMSSQENPYADPGVLEAMMTDITDPAERAARLHGELTFLQGRVWKEYGDHNLIDPFQVPRDWHKSIVIDPHPEKPTAVNWFAEDHEGRLYVYREGDFSGDVQQISDRIKVESAGEYVDLVLIDPSSRQSAKIRGKGSLVGEFRKFFPGVIEANNNREVGWEAVRKLVRNYPGSGPKFFVTRNCPVTDFQMKNYSWKPPMKSGESRSKPEVVKRMEDHCDCIRYRCVAQYANTGSDFKGFNIGVYANA